MRVFEDRPHVIVLVNENNKTSTTDDAGTSKKMVEGKKEG